MSRLIFNPEDPFPLLSRELGAAFDYESEKSHAETVDTWLGLQTEVVEQNIRNRVGEISFSSAARTKEIWLGKSVQTFSTPYTELRSILEDLQPIDDETVIDLGAGYGRLAHVMNRHVPRAKFLGYELVEERQLEGQRIFDETELKNAKLVLGDVCETDFTEISARTFFIYDFGSREDVEHVLEKLKTLAKDKALKIIARGGRSRDAIEKLHPWLSQVVPPLHRGHYSLYRSAVF